MILLRCTHLRPASQSQNTPTVSKPIVPKFSDKGKPAPPPWVPARSPFMKYVCSRAVKSLRMGDHTQCVHSRISKYC